jgi:hypothetical protein
MPPSTATLDITLGGKGDGIEEAPGKTGNTTSEDVGTCTVAAVAAELRATPELAPAPRAVEVEEEEEKGGGEGEEEEIMVVQRSGSSEEVRIRPAFQSTEL